jgi:hypothetical protein
LLAAVEVAVLVLQKQVAVEPVVFVPEQRYQ